MGIFLKDEDDLDRVTSWVSSLKWKCHSAWLLSIERQVFQAPQREVAEKELTPGWRRLKNCSYWYPKHPSHQHLPVLNEIFIFNTFKILNSNRCLYDREIWLPPIICVAVCLLDSYHCISKILLHLVSIISWFISIPLIILPFFHLYQKPWNASIPRHNYLARLKWIEDRLMLSLGR